MRPCFRKKKKGLLRKYNSGVGKMQNDKNFIGLIGLGYWGKNILRNLYELGVLHSACDNEDAVIAEYRKKFPEINYTTSIKEILENPLIKAVAIATPCGGTP